MCEWPDASPRGARRVPGAGRIGVVLEAWVSEAGGRVSLQTCIGCEWAGRTRSGASHGGKWWAEVDGGGLAIHGGWHGAWAGRAGHVHRVGETGGHALDVGGACRKQVGPTCPAHPLTRQ